MSEELDGTELQRSMVQGIYEWAQANEPAIQKAILVTAAIGVGVIEVAERAATALREWLKQPEVASALAMFQTEVRPAILRWVPRLQAAAAAAARLYEQRHHVICAMGHEAFQENDMATVSYFTCEVLGLKQHHVVHVFEALVTSDWRNEVDPLSFLKRQARAAHREELRQETRWASRYVLLLDREPVDGERCVVAVATTTEKRLLSAEERVDLQRAVAEGELTEDAALLLHARLEGMSRTSWHVLGWDKQRLERAWKELDRARSLLMKRLRY